MFSNLRIGAKLGWSFGVVLLLMVLLSGLGINRVGNINKALTTMGDVNSVIQRYVINFRGSVHNRAISIRDVVLVDNPADVPKHMSDIVKLTKDYTDSDGLLAKVVADIGDADEKRIYASLNEIQARTLPDIEKIQQLRQAGQRQEAHDLLMNVTAPKFNTWLDRCNEFIDYEEAKNKVESARARDTASGFRNLMIVMTVIALVIGGVLAWRIAGAISRPLKSAVDVARKVAAGDLTQNIRADGQDEVGEVLVALSGMTEKLRGAISQVRSSVESVNAASGEIASGNADLSARTEQTAANLEKTAASITELTATVAQSAETATQANQLASGAAQAAQKGGEVMQQVVASMGQISESSKKINDIISVIDGIAFQTNILALNAAVEAARAGEQGRGFAVVAGEVRALAQRSAEAAKEIKGLIDNSVRAVDVGSEQVAQAGQSMEEIVSSVRRVSDLIGEITAAAAEQRDGINEVNNAVSNLDQMTQQNAALVEESSAAASSMRDQAQRLAQVVSVFNVGSAGEGAAAPKAMTHAVPKVPSQAAPAPKAVAPKPVAPKPAPQLAKPKTASATEDGDWETF